MGHVAQHDLGEVRAHALDEVQDGAAQAEPAGQVDLHRQPGLGLGAQGAA